MKNRPEISDVQQAVITALLVSFESVIYPGDNNLVLPGSNYDLKPDPLEQSLKGKDWRDHLKTPFDLLGRFSSGLPFSRDAVMFLTPEAFHYYLPVFLTAILLDPNEADVLISTVFTKLDESDLLARMTVGQKSSVRKALEATINEFLATGIEELRFKKMILQL